MEKIGANQDHTMSSKDHPKVSEVVRKVECAIEGIRKADNNEYDLDKRPGYVSIIYDTGKDIIKQEGQISPDSQTSQYSIGKVGTINCEHTRSEDKETYTIHEGDGHSEKTCKVVFGNNGQIFYEETEKLTI